MLSLKPLFTVNRVTVFGDNADPNQFYYLPEQIHLGTESDGSPSFTLLRYMRDITDNPAFTEGQQLGGGFLIFSVNLSLDEDTRTQILMQARRFAPDTPRLVSAPFREGTVRIVALDAAAAPVEGQVRFVENVYGTTTPSLFGDLQATFSLSLSQEGVQLLEQAYQKGGQPIGVVYDLKFLGLRPAFDVTVHADYKKSYQDFDVGIGAQYLVLRAEIEAEFQKLVENKTIDITVNSYTDDATARDQQKQALSFFLDDLLKTFFTSSLDIPKAQSQDILSGLLPQLGMPQTPGRPLSQVTNGAPPAAGAATAVAQQLGVRPVTPPVGATGNVSAAAIRTSSPQNPGQSIAAPAQTPPVTSPAPPTGAVPAPGQAGVGTPPVTGPSGTTPPAAGGTVAHPTPPTVTTPTPARPTPGAAPPPTPAPANSANANNLAIGFHLKYLNQDELKTMDMSWKEAAAVEQTHSPNGTFGFLMRGLDSKKNFIDVDLDSDFFNRIKVMVDCPTPYAAVGLSEVKVHMQYGDRGDGQPKFVNDLELKPDALGHITPQEFTCSLDAKRTLNYSYSVDFYFDPSSPVRGQKTHYTSATLTSQDRTLSIDPQTFVGILKVEVGPGELDFDSIPRVQVKMFYDDAPNNFHVQDTFILTKDKPTFQWAVRLNDPQQNQYAYEVTYFLPDNQTISVPRVAMAGSTAAQNIAVNKPWQDQNGILVDAILNPGVAKLIVDIEYQDATAGYRFSHVKEIGGPADKPYHVAIPLMDPAQRAFTYQVSAVGTDNSVHIGQATSSTAPLIIALPPA